MSYVEEGTKARKTASTLQNPSSSRSHALLTIGVATDPQNVGNSVSTKKNKISPRGGSKLRLVDLAGSESAATCSGVHRLKEGANINKSLVALGNVISALAERGSTGSGPGRRFIPYRDSSLTWLLKDALGGNATTIMLATISPASGSYNETAHTLRFAQRAQSVVNRPVVNEDPVARIIRELKAEVERLKSLLLEKNISPDTKALCCCGKNQAAPNTIENQSPKEETEGESNRRFTEETLKERSQGRETESRVEKGSKSVASLRRSNSSDSATTCEVDSPAKKYGSLEFLSANDRFANTYNRAKVIELNDEEDEIGEVHESVFVDIPTLVAVLIKPDDNLQETSARIEEICSDEVAEEPIEFIDATDETFQDQPNSVNNRSSPVNSCNGSEVDKKSIFKSKGKPKFRKQDSVDVIFNPVLSNLQTLKKFGSVETIQKKKDPVFALERSHTNLEKRSTVADRAKKLNNIWEIDDQKISNGWRGTKELLQRKGSNDSDKSLRDSSSHLGPRIKSHARKPSLESLTRKTSKDSSSSSSKDEQILISSLARRRKSSLEQEPPSLKNHTPIQRVKRAEIVAAVTERLYSSRKQPEDSPGIRSPPETGGSLARFKLQEISRKMLGKRRRVCVETQTDERTIRVKDTASLTETPEIIDVGVLTDDHETCEYGNQRTHVIRVKEMATLTDKPKANIVRCKDVGSLANDLEEYDYEIHSPRNDSGILSDDTQNYAESNLSSTEVSDLCHESDRRVAYAESSTNTSTSSCRSFAVQTPRPDELHRTESKAPACARHCCNSVQDRSTANASDKSIISISLPDTINITIESTNTLESRITVDNDSSQQSLKSQDEEVQTDGWNDHSNEILCSRDQVRTTAGQTDSRVFRIENIFQDPNSAAKNSRVDRTEGTTGIRNSITFRNSLGTSYVSQPKEQTSEGLATEGFISDGLITKAFINRKQRGFHFRKAPSSIVYQDPWRNWQAPVSPANTNRPVNCEKPLAGVVLTSWQSEIDKNLSNWNCVMENGPAFEQEDSCLVDAEEMSDTKSPFLTVLNDYDHGFSDDSLDYNENNLSSESIVTLKKKQMIELRENLCPPDVVAHTKKDSSKSSVESEKSESVDFDDSQVEFPKKNPAESTDNTQIHDYKSLILGRPTCKHEEANESEVSTSVSNSDKKKVSFSSSNTIEKSLSDLKHDSKSSLKSIIKKRRKKIVSEPAVPIHSSNEETDDSQQEERPNSENDWKTQFTSSEESKENPKGSAEQNRKKVKFSVGELSEQTCSESDSYEDEEEDVRSDGRDILDEYLSEAVAFVRNLNSISEYVKETSMLERYPVSSYHIRSGKRKVRRRSSSWNRDYLEYMGRKVSLEENNCPPVQDDDITVSTESYERCLKGIQRLEDCIRRVDRHKELLKEKYGINCESAGARFDLASPSTDPRVPTTNDAGFKTPDKTEAPPKKDFGEEDNLEKKIFDQLMNVANSICHRNSNKFQSNTSDSASRSPSEKCSYSKKESYCGDVRGSLNLEETSEADDDRQDFTTYEITGNLSVGRSCSPEKINDDSSIEDDLLPIRRFDRSLWSTNVDRVRKPSYLSNYETSDRRTVDNVSFVKMYNSKGNVPTNDYSRSCKVCACSKDHSDIEGETMHLRDKLKYPGSPRARFLELLRERRRIVECSRGTSAS